MEETKISIIVPVYNVEQYIKRCMDSLLDQDFEDYEIVVVNDGTPDNSMSYVKMLQRTNDKIVICNRDNGGLSAARNTGISQAKGEYLWFCDSDDALEGNCLSKLYEKAKNNCLDILLFDEEEIGNADSSCHERKKSVWTNDDRIEVVNGSTLLNELVNKKIYNASACGYLIKKQVLEDNHLSFYEGILHEDELFTPIALTNSKRTAYIDWMPYKRYVREGSITTSANYQKRMEGLGIVIKELVRYYDIKLNSSLEKETFQSILMSQMTHFLGETEKIHHPNKCLKQNVKEIREIAKKKGWNLGLKFEAYIIYIKLKKYLGMTICI